MSSSSKDKEREKGIEKGQKQQRESEVLFKPTRPTRPTSTPIYVDGQNGWTSPTGLIPKAGLLVLIDPKGNTRSIDAKRVSRHPCKMKTEEPIK